MVPGVPGEQGAAAVVLLQPILRGLRRIERRGVVGVVYEEPPSLPERLSQRQIPA